jgi:hypothetical protein
MTGTRLKRNIPGCLINAEGAAALAASCLAVHDTGTATGAGFLIFLRTGLLSRGAWDLLLDAIVLLLICAVVAVPAVLLKSGIRNAALYLLSGIALLPLVRPDRIVSPFMGGEVMSMGDAVSAVTAYMPLWILTLSLILLMHYGPGAGNERKTRLVILACISAALIVLSFIIRPFSEIILFASGAVLLLPVLELKAGEKDHTVFLASVVLFIRGMWRLYMAMALYHL